MSYRDACFPGKMFPAHVSLGMRVFPHTFHYRDACFLDCSATLIANVAIANVAIANVRYINIKDQVQVKRNEAIATGVHG